MLKTTQRPAGAGQEGVGGWTQALALLMHRGGPTLPFEQDVSTHPPLLCPRSVRTSKATPRVEQVWAPGGASSPAPFISGPTRYPPGVRPES